MDTMVSPPSRELASPSDPGIFNPRAIIAVVRRRAWPMLAAASIVLALVLVAFLLAEPRYYSEATVGIDRRTDELVKTSEEVAPLSTDSPSVDTEVTIIESPAIAGAVVDRLNLDQVEGFGFPEGGSPTTAEAARQRAVAVVQGGLEAKREGTSYAIDVSYTSEDPELSANIVNAAVDSYVNGMKTERSQQRQQETQLLRDRLGQLRGEVIAAEQAIARYRAATNLIDIQENSTAAQEAIQVLQSQLADARAAQAAAAARAAAARNGSALSDVLQSDVVRTLRSEQATLRAQRADLAGRYGDRHPTLANLDRRLEEIDSQLDAETARIRQSVNSEAQIAASRASSIQGSINRAQGQLLAGNNASVRLNELERNAESVRGLYQLFLDRYRQNLAAQGTEQSGAYVISYARTPNAPISPSPAAYLIGGLVAALVAAALAALVLETMENGFRTRTALETELGIPVIAAMPDTATVKDAPLRRGSPLGLSDHMMANDGSMFSEAFRSLRTALKIGQDGQLARSLAITSALPDEGKTTAAICLARSTALAGLKVVLVDCDLRRRASSRSLTDKLDAGLVEVLQGQATLEQALISDNASGAHLLPQKPSAHPNYDAISSKGMEVLIQRLEAVYDLVILDTAPLLPVAESRAVSAMADGTVLVVRWRKTPARAAALALEELQRTGARVMGAILTKVDLRARETAGMGYEAHYYKSYVPEPA